MKNVIILGSGRSGTSMVAGTLAKAGYFMGTNFQKTRDANPKGFFEDIEVNDINEDILGEVIPQRLRIRGIKRLGIPEIVFFRHRPLKYQRWLACLPLSTQIPTSEAIKHRIEKITQNVPFCLKDPRFSYTISAWQPYLKNTSFICVFRDPASTALSILKECSSVPELNGKILEIKINRQQAIKIWTSMYEYILEKYAKNGEWLFIHYNQVLTEEGLNTLANFTQTQVDRSFPETKLRRTFSQENVSQKALKIYKTLCNLANYED